jgi:hypothetical protein
MQATVFDGMTRQLGDATTRRGLLKLFGGAVTTGAMLAIGHGETAARKRKKRKKQRRQQPAAPTCGDGITNGSETDVDCGGSCPRCTDNRACQVENDCVSGTCAGGRCVTCTPFQLCGSDAHGRCRCDGDIWTGQTVCHSQPILGGFSVRDCAACPPGTEVCIGVGPTVFNCHKRCGSV